MSTAFKFENCKNIRMVNCRSSRFDIGIDAKNSNIAIDGFYSNDRSALIFSNVSGSLNDVRALYQKGLRLSDIGGAGEVRNKALKAISKAEIPHGEKEMIVDALNRVFDSSSEDDLNKAKNSFLDKATQYSTVLSFAWQVVSSIIGR